MASQTRDTAAPADASSSHAHGSKTADDVKSSSPATPLVQVAWPSGLMDTLHAVDHELKLLSHASKYKWVNGCLILLRNALIALSILAIVVVTTVACYREAYRQTLTIAAFDIPESLAARGFYCSDSRCRRC